MTIIFGKTHKKTVVCLTQENPVKIRFFFAGSGVMINDSIYIFFLVILGKTKF